MSLILPARFKGYGNPVPVSTSYSDQTLDTGGAGVNDNINIGAAPGAGERRFIISFAMASAGDGAQFSGANLGGVAMTSIFADNDTAGNDACITAYYGEIATGTTVNFQASLSSSSRTCAYHYRVITGPNGLSIDASSSIVGTTAMGNGVSGLSVQGGGAILAAAHALDGGPFSTTGNLTEDDNRDLESNDWIVAASKDYAVGASGQGFTFDTGGDPGSAEIGGYVILAPS